MQTGSDVALLVPRLKRALRENPNAPQLHCMLGNALLAAGRDGEAAASFERALALAPDLAPALDGVGMVLQRAGRFDEALRFHEQAVLAGPDHAAAHHNHGNALLRLRRYAEARSALERAIEIDPSLPEAHNALGAVFYETGETDVAIGYFRMALERRPVYGDAACNLGNALREAGDIEEATLWFERAVGCEPANARFHRYLVDTRPEPPDGEHLGRMERLAQRIDALAPNERIELHFALGKAYSDLSRYDESFAHFHQGNVLRRAQIAYDEQTDVTFLKAVRDSFTRSFVDAFRGCGHDSERPIFIVGLPRCGSTLVEQILAAHPSVRAMGEIHAFERALVRLPNVGPGATGADVRRSLFDLAERYLRATDEAAQGAARAVDKSLGNYHFVALISLAFPNARIVEVRRDLLDTCWSCYATLFTHPIPFTSDLAELGRYAARYDAFMEEMRPLLPEQLLSVDYERLVADFEPEARRIVDFCGLEWNDACREFHRVRRPVRTASHTQVRKPIYHSSVGRAQHFASHLEPLREALGGRLLRSENDHAPGR